MKSNGYSAEPREASGQRKRAYHRALKRGASWAVVKKTTDGIMIKMFESMYSEYVLKENPLLKMTGLSTWLRDPVKIIYGDGTD